MEILKELDGFDQNIYKNIENPELYRYYTYCRRIGEKNINTFGIEDHFSPNYESFKKKILTHTQQLPCHLPQHKFVELLYEKHQNLQGKKGEILLGHEVSSLESDDSGVNLQLKSPDGKVFDKDYDWVIGADGQNGISRKIAGIDLSGNHSK